MDEVEHELLLKIIKGWVNNVKNEDYTMMSVAKQLWKFKSPSDWHYGKFVGTLLGIAINMHQNSFGPISSSEIAEIERLILENSDEVREHFEDFDYQ